MIYFLQDELSHRVKIGYTGRTIIERASEVDTIYGEWKRAGKPRNLTAFIFERANVWPLPGELFRLPSLAKWRHL